MDDPSTRRPQYRPPEPLPKRPMASPPRPAAPAMATTTPPTRWTFPRILLIVGAVLVLLAPLYFGNPMIYLFVGVFLAPVLIGLVFVLAVRRPWGYLVGGILAALGPLAIIALFAYQQLANPLMSSEFQASWTLLVGLLLIVPATIVGFRAARHGQVTTFGQGIRAPLGLYSIACIALLLGMSVAGGLAGSEAKEQAARGTGYDFTPDSVVDVDVREFEFPDPIIVPIDQIVEIVAVNHDSEFHTFSYERNGTTYEHDLLGSSTARFLVRFTEPGVYKLWCRPHSAGAEDVDPDSMIGTIVVNPI